jgi:hypothetical protein
MNASIGRAHARAACWLFALTTALALAPVCVAAQTWEGFAGDPPVHFVGLMAYDIGGKKLVEATMSDGSSQSISANQGFGLSAGLATFKAFEGRLATQATIGFESWSIDASNGGVKWLAYPLELMEFVYAKPVRFGAGISYLLNPKLTGSGLASAIDVRFKNSLGLALEGDWVFPFAGSARRSRVTLGGRWVWQKLEVNTGGPAIDASSFAILLGFTG